MSVPVRAPTQSTVGLELPQMYWRIQFLDRMAAAGIAE